MAKLNAVQRPKSRVPAFFLVLFYILCTFSASNSSAKQSESPYFIEGYDVVSYFRDSGPILGNTNFIVETEEFTYLFSSKENLIDFESSPESYIPAYNGNCAYGMVYGMESTIDPMQYDIVDGKLYLQLNGGTKNRWNRRVSRNIKKADRIWKKLSSPSE